MTVLLTAALFLPIGFTLGFLVKPAETPLKETRDV